MNSLIIARSLLIGGLVVNVCGLQPVSIVQVSPEPTSIQNDIDDGAHGNASSSVRPVEIVVDQQQNVDDQRQNDTVVHAASLDNDNHQNFHYETSDSDSEDSVHEHNSVFIPKVHQVGTIFNLEHMTIGLLPRYRRQALLQKMPRHPGSAGAFRIATFRNKHGFVKLESVHNLPKAFDEHILSKIDSFLDEKDGLFIRYCCNRVISEQQHKTKMVMCTWFLVSMVLSWYIVPFFLIVSGAVGGDPDTFSPTMPPTDAPTAGSPTYWQPPQ